MKHGKAAFQIEVFIPKRIGTKLMVLVGVIMDDRRAMRVLFNDPETTGKGRGWLAKTALNLAGVDTTPGPGGGRYRIGNLPEGSSDRYRKHKQVRLHD